MVSGVVVIFSFRFLFFIRRPFSFANFVWVHHNSAPSQFRTVGVVDIILEKKFYETDHLSVLFSVSAPMFLGDLFSAVNEKFLRFLILSAPFYLLHSQFQGH